MTSLCLTTLLSGGENAELVVLSPIWRNDTDLLNWAQGAKVGGFKDFHHKGKGKTDAIIIRIGGNGNLYGICAEVTYQ